MYRKSLREQTFKLLFRIEFNSSEEMTEQEELFFNNDDITFSEKDRTEIEKKYADVIKNLPAIDKELSEVAKDWDLDRIGKVELTILRLGVYEVEYDDSIPEGVAVNEAVELAKKFGQDAAPDFVNAVLSRFTIEGKERAAGSAADGKTKKTGESVHEEKSKSRDGANIYIVKTPQ